MREFLAAMDTAIACGAENRVTDKVKTLAGRSPRDFVPFAATVREVW